jgi:hypothetical protein
MRVIELVADSLRYWATETHVDGFRFDLGTILARETKGFDTESGFLKACCQDPELRTVKLIAEPWDCGPGGYQVGRLTNRNARGPICNAMGTCGCGWPRAASTTSPTHWLLRRHAPIRAKGLLV